MSDAILTVTDLKTEFRTRRGTVRAVDGVSWQLRPGEILGIVGESGSGKSVTAMSILRLLAKPTGRIVGGQIHFHHQDLVTMPERQLRQIRGNRIAMIFQEPMTSLNPVFTLGRQITETLIHHQKMDHGAALRRAIELLDLVRIPDAAQRVHEYPFQLSGGMRQRVMIAMALACQPEILIADEPTTALDVTIQAQILDLLLDLRREFNTAILLITHDFGVVAEICDRVLVMYAGRKVEEATVNDIFVRPGHPYTQKLMRARPLLGHASERLEELPGSPPVLGGKVEGCPFLSRCDLAFDLCHKTPQLFPIDGAAHVAACWRAEQGGLYV